MSEKGLYYPIVRKIITAVVLLIIAGSFLAIYFFTYLPQEHAQYNARIFRVLHEISENFEQRVENYSKVYSNNLVTQNYVTKKYTDDSIHNIPLLKDSIERKNFDHFFQASFKGNAQFLKDSFSSSGTIIQDSALYKIYKKNVHGSKDVIVDSEGKPLSEILEPLISVHSDVFESVLLIKQKHAVEADEKHAAKYDEILYESNKSDIANINTDSLFKNNSIESPVISDLDIEGVTYKVFLLPFKMLSSPDQTFVLAGIIPDDVYRDQSQSIPIYLLLSVCFVLIIILVALPFLKIYFLSAEENININDVRAIIAVIFIIPFFVTLMSAGVWLSYYSNNFTTGTLSSLQDSLQQNFYDELRDMIHQTKRYDDIIQHPSSFITDSTKIKIDSNIVNKIKHYDSISKIPVDLKDIIFYPNFYKNVTSLHWMDSAGNDIAAWNLNKLPTTYFALGDRSYFKDIKYNRTYTFPDSEAINKTDSFSLQPVLSRLTGDFTFNLAIHSNAQIGNKKAIAVAISSKMYSVYNTILPHGFAFCIIDENGNIVCHSDTARSLQENIFEESSDSFALRSIISHKDSVLRTDFNLYDEPVKMLIKPLPGLPYYLITYYKKRGQYLFIFHEMSFVFICEAALLLFVSLFSYCMMMSNKKHSKLFFAPATLNWLKPSAEKKDYYLKNSIQFIATACMVGLVSLFFNGNEYYLYMLNMALLFPLFSITGYYIIKASGTFYQHKKAETFSFTKNQFLKFLFSIRNILLLYITSIVVFVIFQNILFFNTACKPNAGLIAAIWILIIFLPLIISYIAGINFNYKHPKPEEQTAGNNNYLAHFIISLLLGVTLTSVIPTIIFSGYAFHEEKTFQLQSLQIDLAKKIQQRRNDANQILWQTKLNIFPLSDTSNIFNKSANAYVNQLKFKKDKGIYLLENDSIAAIDSFKTPDKKITNCSPFYKTITQYLFLPPDHDEFYDDSTHDQYYYWAASYNKQDKKDSLKLYYKNITDNKYPVSFSLISVSDHYHLFQDFGENYIGILALIIFVFLFYKVIYSVSVRIFLIGFFKDINGNANNQDAELLKQISQQPDLETTIKKILGINKELSFATIREKENEKFYNNSDGEAYIIEMHLALMNVYENIWQNCTDIQKYTLYDFAIDGFTNYKKVMVLYQLYKAGLLIKEPDGNISLMTKSFRNFLITKEASPEISILNKQSKNGSWSSLRTIFYIILIGVAIFIFMSQEEASKRLITIITSLGALLPAMLKLFDKSSSATAGVNKSSS